MRTALLSIFYVALVVACASLVYLLFIFGHTETAPLGRVLTVAAIGGVSAVVAGILQWAGLPPKETDEKD
jgi:hypothetical protein